MPPSPTRRSTTLATRGTEATPEELARATGLSRTQVADLLAAQRTPRSLEEPGTPGDGLADPAAEEAYDLVLDAIEQRRVRELAEQLSDRERAVVLAHYGLGRPARTLGRIGQELGVSAERVRQIEAAALAKLRTALARTATP